MWPEDIEAQLTLLREIAPASPDREPWEFLDRLPASQRAGLRPALLRLLDDESALVRELALGHCMRLPHDDATFAKLLGLVGVDRGTGQAHTLQRALASLAHSHDQHRDAARAIKQLAGATRPVALVPAVIHEPDWLIEVAREHAATDHHPLDWVVVAGLFALYRRDRLLEILDVLAALPEHHAYDALDEVARELARDPKQREKLLGEQHRVDAANVTLDGCRKALRLEPIYVRIEGDPGETWLVETAVEALAELGVVLSRRRTVVATSARSSAYGGESVRSHRYRIGTAELGLEVEVALEEWVEDDEPADSGASPQRRPAYRAHSFTAEFAANSSGRPRRLSITLEARGLRPSRRFDGGIWRLEGPGHLDAHAWFWIGGPADAIARSAARIRSRAATKK